MPCHPLLYNRSRGCRYRQMELTGLVYRYRRLILKLAPLLVLALIWAWVMIAILVVGSQDISLRTLFGWGFMV